MRHFLITGFQMLSALQKRKGGVIVMLLVIGSLLDFFSLASFLPLIFLLINPDRTLTNKYIADLNQLLGFTDPAHVALALTLMVVVFIFIKTQINSWITYRKAQYAYDVAGSLASLALTRYLLIPYVQFTNTDFTKEMNRIANLPLAFANNIIIPAGTMLSEFVVLLLLLGAIVWYDPGIFLFIMLLIAPAAFVYQLKRKKIKDISAKIKGTYPVLLKRTMQAVEALPEIRTFRKEKFFKRKFNTVYQVLGETFSKDHTAHVSTSRTTELIAALCISVLIGYAVATRLPGDNIMVLLSIYAGVAFRAIPSVNRILAASLQMRSNEYVVTELSQIVVIKEDPFEPVPALPFREKIELSGISIRYDSNISILEKASLCIRKGEKIILSGKSGTGKTTLLYLLLRFIKEQEGTIRVDGVTLTDQNALAWRRNIGYVPQNPYILDASVKENIAFGVPDDQIDLTKISEVVDMMDLGSWVEAFPEKTNTVIGERGARISGGQRQRLAIARALYHDAEVLLLDEVTNQLDAQTENEVMKAIDHLLSQNKTIILITHRPELWTSFDTVYELRDGQFERVTIKTMQTASGYAG